MGYFISVLILASTLLVPINCSAIDASITPQKKKGRLLVYSKDSWMSDIKAVIGSKKISQIVIPGTHDSGTSDIGWTQGWSYILPAAQAATGKTQTKTIGQQLNDGIRYFDLRVEEVAHRDCADPTVFWLNHPSDWGPYRSYSLVSAIDQILAYVQDEKHAKEIIILDFQKVEDFYSDARNTAVMFGYVQSRLGPYLLDQSTPEQEVTSSTLNKIWNYNLAKGKKGQILLMTTSGWVDMKVSGCGNSLNGSLWVSRSSLLNSVYNEAPDTKSLMMEQLAQLNDNWAKAQGRSSYYTDYKNTLTKGGLNELAFAPRPSDAWFGSTVAAWTANMLCANSYCPNLLDYSNDINRDFNVTRETCLTGWLGKRLWMGINRPSGSLNETSGNWNKPNILMIDNYDAGGYWTTVSWDGSNWKRKETGGFVDFVIRLNINDSPGSKDTVITSFQDNQCL